MGDDMDSSYASAPESLMGSVPAMQQNYIEIPGVVQDGIVTKIYSDATAVDAISHAFYIDGIAVSQNHHEDPYAAVDESTRTLMTTGHYPTHEMSRNASQNAEDFLPLPNVPDIQYLSHPPFAFDNLELSRVLACLRANARLQGEGVLYQLGIRSTRTDMDGTAQATLMSMIPGNPVTSTAKTIWLHRTCSLDFASWSGFEEKWKGLSFRNNYASAMQPDHRLLHTTRLPSQTPETPGTPGMLPIPPLSPNSASVAPEFLTAPPDLALLTPGSWPLGTVAPRVKHIGSDAAWDNLYLMGGQPIKLIAGDILNGAVHPKNICGRLILEIAKVRSDIEIKQALALLYPVAGSSAPDIKGAYVTKLITNALKAKAGKPGCGADDPDYLAERFKLNGARQKNGVKFSSRYNVADDAEMEAENSV